MTNDNMSEKLVKLALDMGANQAVAVPVQQISVEDELAALCKNCDVYGQSAKCPPFGMKPEEFRAALRNCEFALFFKIDVPIKILMTDARYEISRKIHRIAAGLEQAARENGYTDAAGFGAGSCKPVFCGTDETCPALLSGGSCCQPDLSRPSLSGVGVNVFKLSEYAGWPMDRITKNTDADDEKNGMMAGLVITGQKR